MYTWIAISFVLTVPIAAQEEDFPALKGPYLGQKPPGMKPEIFAPGLVSHQKSVHSATVFSPDGNEVYWTVMSDPKPMRIRYMQQTDSVWSQPRDVPFNSSFSDANPFFCGPDSIFFKSYRDGGNSIWITSRSHDEWSEPADLGDPFSSSGLAWQASITKSGTIYFVMSKDGFGGHDIYRSEKINGSYDSAEKLDPPINSGSDDWQPFIDPDEEYIIFGRYYMPDSLKMNGLYISFRLQDGTWSEPANMGLAINGDHGAYWPYVSPDKKYFFFVSDMDNGNWHYNVYWVDARIIENLKPTKGNIN
jgi:hypothetical protein